MFTSDQLVPGKMYKLTSGEILEFSRIGGTSMAILHPAGESDMQSSVAVTMAWIEREATPEETARCRRWCS